MVNLGDVRLQSARSTVDLFAVIRSSGAVDIKTGKDLGNRLVNTEDNLDMAGRVLATNGDSMLRPYGSRLRENGVADAGLDLLDLSNGSLFGKAVQEEVDIGGRAELLMVELAHGPHGAVKLLRDRQNTVDDRTTSGNDVIPIHLGEGALGEEIKIALKVLEGLDNSRGAGWSAKVLRQRHDIPLPYCLGLEVRVAGSDRNLTSAIGIEREHIDIRVPKSLVIGFLGEELTQMCFIAPVGLKELDHGGIGVLLDVARELSAGARKNREDR